MALCQDPMGGYDISKWKEVVNSELSMEYVALFSCLGISKAIVDKENS